MDELSQIFKILSDKNRLRILKMLEKKPLCVCEMTQILGLAASTTSKHLSLLKDVDLIFEQKDKKWVNYHLNRASQNKNIKTILPLIEGWLNEDETIQRDLEKVISVDRTQLCQT